MTDNTSTRPTLTSTGRVSSAHAPGPADALTGMARRVAVWRRLRMQHGPLAATKLMVRFWRTPVALGGGR